jgi:biopolymer transport protein ExbD
MNDLFGMDDPLSESADASLDLTPIIDVVFLLLIFFIMATTFSMPVLDVVLPRADSAEPVQEKNATLVLTIDPEGRVLHKGTELDRVTLAELLNSNQAMSVTLFVDERAPFEPFVMVMDQAKLARRTNVSITTQPAP